MRPRLSKTGARGKILGADMNPSTRQVTFEALINIRPGQDNPALEVLDPLRRERIVHVVRHLLEPK